jgi:isoquinoline 1-oxidoreductase beta subunit
MKKGISRRKFLAGAGLTLAVVATPVGFRFFAGRKTDTLSEVFRPSVWVKITPDDRVTVLMGKSEMGQGIHTALPMIVADELDADWKHVHIERAPVREEYDDPEAQQGHVTYGSTSVRHLYGPLRKAGAAGREMLLEAAAQEWGVPVSECETSQSQVLHKRSGRAFSYGELSEAAAQLPVPENPRLKDKSEFKLMGTAVPRLDIPAKVNGQAQFGIDVFVPDMLYGVVARSPAYGGRLLSYDESAAMNVDGVRYVGEIERGIGVCADTLDAAWKGKEALNAKWDPGVRPDLSDELLESIFKESLDKEGASAHSDGDVEDALSQAHKRVQAEYFLPYLSHATMEPMTCTAHVQSDRCDVWLGTQGQTNTLQKTAQITGLDPEQIYIHTTYLGGGFGRRGWTEFVEEAVELSKATERPVKVIWKREEDIQCDSYRPGNSSRIVGGLDEQGRLIAWSHKIAAPSIIAELFRKIGGDSLLFRVIGFFRSVDTPAVEGLENLQYEIPNMSVDYVEVETPIPVIFWRSVGNSHNAFTVESFIDEMAYVAQKDPVEFRLQHLNHNPRAQRAVELVAEKSGWGKPLDSGRARGIASFYSFGSYVAQVAEVSVDETSGKIKVHRVVCAVDCGPTVNTDIIRAQMEGALTMGLSAALKEKVEFGDGGVQSANFFDYHLLRMSEAPDEIDVHIVDSDGEIGGIGEPGLPPIAPAVANAVFAATGARIRRLPMTPETVKTALRPDDA